jgi:dTDP-4-amino-4,6-dideoxygalactose transaminase
VLATNLFGLPNDLRRIVRVARQHGAFVIDDAAQAMGASLDGRASGTWGDAGLYSFDKGKNVSAIDGGVVVTGSDAVASAVRAEMAGVGPAPWLDEARGVAKALVYFAMLRPWLYWIPNSLPQLQLGKTVFTTEFPVEQPSRALAALGRTMIRRLDDFTEARVANAGRLLARIGSIPGMRTISPVPGSRPVYLRLPVLLPDHAARDRALGALQAAGIGATGSYPASLVDVPEVGDALAGAADAPGGREVADRILTLPTHAFVGRRDLETAAGVLRRALGH